MLVFKKDLVFDLLLVKQFFVMLLIQKWLLRLCLWLIRAKETLGEFYALQHWVLFAAWFQWLGFFVCPVGPDGGVFVHGEGRGLFVWIHTVVLPVTWLRKRVPSLDRRIPCQVLLTGTYPLVALSLRRCKLKVVPLVQLAPLDYAFDMGYSERFTLNFPAMGFTLTLWLLPYSRNGF